MTTTVNRNTRGVAWSAIERFGIQGSQFIASVILARMLIPADYGLIAMLSIFIVISTALVDSGMAQALIQRQQRSEEDLTTALIFNVAVGVALYAIIYICAPYIAQFYNTPELCSVTRVLAVVLIINSLGVVQQALITINLDFKRQAKASLSGIIIGSCVAIVLANRGYGVWALVALQITSDTLRTAIIWVMSGWRPTGRFSWASFSQLSGFGSKIMASGLIHVIYVNLYPLIIGRYFAASELGLFNRATTVGALPSTNISTIVDRALYPVLCTKQELCGEASVTMQRYLRVVCFFVFPMMVGLAVLAEPTIRILLGDRWLGVAPLLRIIAIAYMWDPIMKFTGSVIKSQGRSSDFLRAEVIKKISGVVILIATIPFGIEVMAQGLILYAFADMTIVIHFARRIDPSLGYRNTLSLLIPTVAMAATMGAIIHFALLWLDGVSAPLVVMICTVIGATVYLIFATLLHRPEPQELLRIIRSYKK